MAIKGEKTKMRIEQDDEGGCADPFIQIMEKVGTNGRFQLIYNALFVTCLSIFGNCLYMNIILALNVPEHWCIVPGGNNTNVTHDEWKAITLPM